MSRETSGKREHQKIKPYIVFEYLMRNSDEQHAIPASDIINYLQDDCQIDAERRSIYRDIDEINKVLYMLENECSIQEAEEVIDSEDGEEEKFIVYDKNKKGFYVRQRKYDTNDIRLLAECVYSARFIDEKRAKRLAKLTGSFVSQWQADDILHDAFLVDRTKTTNTASLAGAWDVTNSADIASNQQVTSKGSSKTGAGGAISVTWANSDNHVEMDTKTEIREGAQLNAGKSYVLAANKTVTGAYDGEAWNNHMNVGGVIQVAPDVKSEQEITDKANVVIGKNAKVTTVEGQVYDAYSNIDMYNKVEGKAGGWNGVLNDDGTCIMAGEEMFFHVDNAYALHTAATEADLTLTHKISNVNQTALTLRDVRNGQSRTFRLTRVTEDESAPAAEDADSNYGVVDEE